MQDIRNYIAVFIILSSILIFWYLFFLTRREIKLEKKFNSFALSTTKDTNTLLDNINNIFKKILDLLSKIIEKNKFVKHLSLKYEKYVFLSDEAFTTFNIITLKIILFFLTFVITFGLEYFNVININYFSVILISIFAYFLPNCVLKIQYAHKTQKISYEIVDAIVLINNNLKKGLNLINALDEVILELPKTLKKEFQKVKFDLENGLNVATAFNHFDKRIELSYTNYINKTITTLSSFDVNINDIFAFLEEKLSERKDSLDKLTIYSSGARLFYKVTVSIPVFIILLIIIFKPSYFLLVIDSLPASLLFLSLTLIYISYIILVKRLLKGE